MAAPPSEAVRVAVMAIVLTIVCARPGVAQPTVDALAQLSQVIRPGTLVIVTDEKGQRVKGKIAELSDVSLDLRTGSDGTISFRADRVMRVSRVDSRLNGFLIGAAAGLVPGLLLGHGLKSWCINESGDHCDTLYLYPGGLLGLAGGWIGFVIDNAIDGQTLVFARRGVPAQARVTPMFGDHLAGVRVSLKF